MKWILRASILAAVVVFVFGSTPSGTYAPGYVECPANFGLRPANGLSPNETAWLAKRRPNIINALTSYLQLANLTGFDSAAYIQNLTANSSLVPTSAFAVSGGGWTSCLNGLGAYQAMDARYAPAVSARTGGLAQCLTYITGLSGGSFAVSTLAGNNYPTIAELWPQWDPTVDIFTGANVSNEANYYTNIFETVALKAEQGFNVSLSDILGQLLSYAFLPPNGSESKTYSDIQTFSNFSNGLAPFPILLLNEVIRTNGSPYEHDGIYEPTPNATFYEYNPFEWGAWDGRVSAFIPTQYLGTTMFNGSAVNNTCVLGFDQMGFAMGSSSSAWNFWLLESLSNNTLGQFAKRDFIGEQSIQKRQSPPDGANPEVLSLITYFESTFNLSLNDSLYAVYPNPFQGYTNSQANEAFLEIVDGSESGQTIPFWPLLQPPRAVDFIIAFDGSSETPFGWQNGTNMIDTYNAATAAGLKFPKMPSAETFIDFQYNELPTFFGCYEDDVPIILYLSNSPWNAYTNFSFTQDTFYPSQLNTIFDNSFQQLTYINSTGDPEWPACLACALIHGSIKRLGLNDTAQCQECWSRHCWNGVNTNKTAAQLTPFEPSLLMIPGLNFAEWNATEFGPFPS